MPWKNPSEHYYPPTQIRILREESAFYEALNDAAKKQGITLQKYFLRAAFEKLVRDGYLLESDVNPRRL